MLQLTKHCYHSKHRYRSAAKND